MKEGLKFMLMALITAVTMFEGVWLITSNEGQSLQAMDGIFLASVALVNILVLTVFEIKRLLKP